MYASGISKKQAGVIFAANKQGKINIPDAAIKYMYNHFVDVHGAHYDDKECDAFDRLRDGIEAIFANDYEKAQEVIMSVFVGECIFFNSKEINELKIAIGFND